ncbi:MAG: hypothetical protein A2487_03790 [Candidatus Raymondbacteria bacterium RifOxyC12_full_50_8]|uniref:Uncharacterized protein n=1 Tax=Candidatus Raymondbacteria bacterium RIFOXYD12_FULL_49_13 TaxID=1817890 RepID=A0A1F7FF58_UNCRA|nr:MAG: hypothetical protein A2350_13330 [Candidatus Raymondbacteria bacterium RifOxyB12_full_50_8]OGK05086.1 MAG: hypothetical protein A2519_11745 [Candidatus Raymondbacteria bacterium RIFOXYD12_FULL_49_13]OGK06725.1 MAG: hypothetical protein A2487_03790 [Candidatus Raymondbacteria bacterium RifOxyC12_full_50_8]OGP41256.1 MAG: hypothetical protein A2324_08280 [Candidatus Raymondbacteria bacterium RIFOXYB2_FULL_49_35]
MANGLRLVTSASILAETLFADEFGNGPGNARSLRQIRLTRATRRMLSGNGVRIIQITGVSTGGVTRNTAIGIGSSSASGTVFARGWMFAASFCNPSLRLQRWTQHRL